MDLQRQQGTADTTIKSRPSTKIYILIGRQFKIVLKVLLTLKLLKIVLRKFVISCLIVSSGQIFFFLWMVLGKFAYFD